MPVVELILLRLSIIFSKKIKKIFKKDSNFFIKINSKNLVPLFSFLKLHSALRFTTVVDICVLDLLKKKKKFIIFYQLLSVVNNSRFFFCVNTSEAEGLPSLSKLFFGINWLEREVWDMFGIMFYNHPDLRRILTDYGFSGNPLRKDFAVSGYREIWYSDKFGRVLYVPVSLTQEIKTYRFKKTWV